MKEKHKFAAIDISLIALFTALTAILSWISIDIGPVPFTLQTFAVFLTCGLLGSKKGSLVVLIYILLGAIGVPVFAGFKSTSALIGPTAGFIFGFIFIPLIYMPFELCIKTENKILKLVFYIIPMIIGLLICYAFGSLWFFMYMKNQDVAYSIGKILSICVIPFIGIDIAKLVLASILSFFLKRFVPTNKNKLVNENDENQKSND